MRTTSLFFSLFVLMTGCDGGPKARTEIETPDAASQTEDAAGSVRDAATPKPDQGEEPVVHPDAATSDAMPDSGIETAAASGTRCRARRRMPPPRRTLPSRMRC